MLNKKYIAKLSNDEKARQVENKLIRYAGVVRNLIIEGLTYEEATKHERATYWLKDLNKY